MRDQNNAQQKVYVQSPKIAICSGFISPKLLKDLGVVGISNVYEKPMNERDLKVLLTDEQDRIDANQSK
jgi:hypothetical protein